jgi:hypothetical protein
MNLSMGMTADYDEAVIIFYIKLKSYLVKERSNNY